MRTKTFGQRIRELREEKDLSLRELAKQLEMSAPFLSDIELGRRYPSEKFLIEIARILGVTVDDLRSYDTRVPIEELKRLAESTPAFGIALRRIVDKKITADDLNKIVEGIEHLKKKKT